MAVYVEVSLSHSHVTYSIGILYFNIHGVEFYAGYNHTKIMAKLQNTRPLVTSYHVATISLDTRSELVNIIFHWIRGYAVRTC